MSDAFWLGLAEPDSHSPPRPALPLSDQPIAFLSVLHPPEVYGLPSSSSPANVKILDLTCSVPGYAGPSSAVDQPNSMEAVMAWLLNAVQTLGRRTQVFIDGLDTLAEDYGSLAGARKLVRDVLKAVSKLKGEISSSCRPSSTNAHDH